MWRLKIARGPASDDEAKYLFSTNNYVGRQTWEFDPDAGSSEERAEVEEARLNFYNNRFNVRPCSDLLWRFQFLREKNFKQSIPQVKIEEGEEVTYGKATIALRRALKFFCALQADDGHWPAEITGCLFFLPPLVMCLYITGHLDSVLSAEHRKEILRHIYCYQNEDGGWGLHVEGHSIMFVTVINYICMRILGEGLMVVKIMQLQELANGSLIMAEQLISLLGGRFGFRSLESLSGLEPTQCPLKSGYSRKLLCYCRLVYLPLSYLYGRRFVAPITPLILQLRQELHTQPYHLIKWRNVRHLCAKEDLYYPHPLIQDLLWDSLYTFVEPLLTRWPFNKLVRKMALATVMRHIHYEDENSRYITIGCVEKVLCMLACWVDDPNGDSYKKHLARIPDYLWIAEDGMKMQTNSTNSDHQKPVPGGAMARNMCNKMPALGLGVKPTGMTEKLGPAAAVNLAKQGMSSVRLGTKIPVTMKMAGGDMHGKLGMEMSTKPGKAERNLEQKQGMDETERSLQLPANLDVLHDEISGFSGFVLGDEVMQDNGVVDGAAPVDALNSIRGDNVRVDGSRVVSHVQNDIRRMQGLVQQQSVRHVRNTKLGFKPGQHARSFASLVSSDPMERKMKMQFFEPVRKDSIIMVIMVEPPAEVVAESVSKWQDCLVGYFVGKRLPFKSVDIAVRKLWNKYGLSEILTDDNGFYYFRVPDAQARLKILDVGMWLMFDRPCFLQQWSPDLVLSKQEHDRIPIWVKFYNVPLSMWSSSGLSHIASAVGKSLYVDGTTEGMSRLSFARVCCEIDAAKPLIDDFVLRLKNAEHRIRMEYQWKPPTFQTCKVFGHTMSDVTRHPKNITVEKIVAEPATNGVDQDGFQIVRNRKKVYVDVPASAKQVEKILPATKETPANASAGNTIVAGNIASAGNIVFVANTASTRNTASTENTASVGSAVNTAFIPTDIVVSSSPEGEAHITEN
ncbi:Beta-amyrin synthase-like protein, partial [Drosera capensis]